MNKLFCLLSVVASLYSAQEEIIIPLEVKHEQEKVYLCRWDYEYAKLSAEEIDTFLRLLQQDLLLSGHLALMPIDENKEALFAKGDYKQAFAHAVWGAEGIAHVIKIRITGSELKAFVFSRKSQTLKQIQNVSLLGSPEKSRPLIHKLADAIHKILFQIDGVASTHLLYSFQDGRTSEIWMCDWDGGNPHRVTYENSMAITPLFFPAVSGYLANKYLYVSYKTGLPKICLGVLGEPQGRPFISLRGNQLLPAMSRDRTWLAFISDAGGRADLFVQKIDALRGPIGKPIQAYSAPGAVQASPAFSPSGNEIAFVSDKEGTPRIYIIATPKGPLTHLPEAMCITFVNRENTCPAWSPDGSKIAYSAKTDNTRQIWIFDVQERKEWQLTTGSGHKENPAWAPDSFHLVYNTCEPESSELYIINLGDKKSVKISSGPGKKHYPAWER